MNLLGAKHTWQSVLAEIVRGLEDGKVVLPAQGQGEEPSRQPYCVPGVQSTRLLIRGVLVLMAGAGAGLLAPAVMRILDPEAYQKDDMFFIGAGIGAGLLGSTLAGILFVLLDSLAPSRQRSWPSDRVEPIDRKSPAKKKKGA